MNSGNILKMGSMNFNANVVGKKYNYDGKCEIQMG
jgi:hypothetical protein